MVITGHEVMRRHVSHGPGSSAKGRGREGLTMRLLYDGVL